MLPPLAGDWPTHIPTSAELGLAPDPCPHRQRGGRSAAMTTLDSFLYQRGRDYRYRMSSPVTAFDASSRLSPHLAWGTISMREVAQANWARMRELKTGDEPGAQSWRASLLSCAGRQHWHCHFMQKLEDEPRIEFENLHRAYDGRRPDVADARRLAAWSEGNTGFPFVDACMRALNQHGWINFRMRAMLMSFASYHLWLPWRESGLHLARKFVDYEAGIHWPQVQMQSGTTGINTVRIYNPLKQGYDQDPTGQFVRAHLPELASVPDVFIHEPWRWDRASSLSYPPPIVDNAAAARAARDALHGIRKRADHKTAARDIVDRHGSRKTGMPMTGARRGTGRKPAFDLALDLGCGTGLMASALGPMARRIEGVDISPRMIAVAARTGLYAALHVGEVVDELDRRAAASADLIVAADMVVYLGDLFPLFREAARVLRPGGLFAFTAQGHHGQGFELGIDSRFAHSDRYLRTVAEDSGLAIAHFASVSTRQDRGLDVPGYVMVLTLPR
jgi:SAM-dependent methyltransferase